MHDVQCAPEVADLLPADLLDALRTRVPRPYRCVVCGQSGILGETGDSQLSGTPLPDESPLAVSLLVFRYPGRQLRQVRFAHAACRPSQVIVVTDEARAERELASGSSVARAVMLAPRPGERVGIPVLALDDDDALLLTDAHRLGNPDALLPGERINPQISHGLATGLALCTSLGDLPPAAHGWSAKIGRSHVDLRHPLVRPGRRPIAVIERLACQPPPNWRSAVRREGDTVLLLVGDIGLSSVVRTPSLSAVSRASRMRQAAAQRRAVTRAVLAAMTAGQVAGGVIPVSWQDDQPAGQPGPSP